MEWLTNNFPHWESAIIVGSLTGSGVTVVIYLWLAFWEWRDRKTAVLIEKVIFKLQDIKSEWVPLHLRRKHK